MKKVYFYPSANKEGYQNPYCDNFKKIISSNFHLLDKKNKKQFAAGWNLLKMSFRADIFILNWLENIYFHRLGLIQFYLALIALRIIDLRKKKIIWIFHNIHPHQGENTYTTKIQNWLFKHSNLIISHSEEAANYAKKRALNSVYYKCHPIKRFPYQIDKNTETCDVLIWGSILPYKGIAEFLSYLKSKKSTIKVIVLGKCNDKKLAESINSLCNNNVIFYNRKAEFNEIASMIDNCKYVLFPYIGDCVSSSGALIDSIVMGGTVCGPNKGAFKDLSHEGISLVYNSYDELYQILTSNKKIDNRKRNDFITENSWERFSDFLTEKIQKL